MHIHLHNKMECNMRRTYTMKYDFTNPYFPCLLTCRRKVLYKQVMSHPCLMTLFSQKGIRLFAFMPSCYLTINSLSCAGPSLDLYTQAVLPEHVFYAMNYWWIISSKPVPYFKALLHCFEQLPSGQSEVPLQITNIDHPHPWTHLVFTLLG